MEKLAYSGEVYLNPASEYNNELLSKGAYDPKELYVVQQLPTGSKVQAQDKVAGEWHTLDVVKWGPLKIGPVPDYYTFCMTTMFNPSMFHEFGADTCVMIRNPSKFMEMLAKAVNTTLAGWGGAFDYATYYSREKFYSFDLDYRDVMFAKEECYAPQKEFRFVCIPPDPVEKLEPITVNVGQLLFDTSLCFKGEFSPSPLE